MLGNDVLPVTDTYHFTILFRLVWAILGLAKLLGSLCALLPVRTLNVDYCFYTYI